MAIVHQVIYVCSMRSITHIRDYIFARQISFFDTVHTYVTLLH